MTSIGKYNFDGCEKLTEIISLITEPFPIKGLALTPSYRYMFLLALKSHTISMYEILSAPEWGKNFTSGGFDYNIISMDMKTVEIQSATTSMATNVIIKVILLSPKQLNGMETNTALRELGTKLSVEAEKWPQLLYQVVISIGEQAFSQCNGLTSTTIIKPVTIHW